MQTRLCNESALTVLIFDICGYFYTVVLDCVVLFSCAQFTGGHAVLRALLRHDRRCYWYFMHLRVRKSTLMFITRALCSEVLDFSSVDEVLKQRLLAVYQTSRLRLFSMRVGFSYLDFAWRFGHQLHHRQPVVEKVIETSAKVYWFTCRFEPFNQLFVY